MNIIEILKIVITWIIPTVLGGISSYIYKELKENKKANEAIKASMLSLIRSQIVSKCETYTKLGYLPEYARYCLEDLFKQYKILGGNHGIETLVNECFKLPPTKKKKERRIKDE